MSPKERNPKTAREKSEMNERYGLASAKEVTDQLVRLLAPHCERIAVAGSIRRKRPDVKDIELLCASKVTSTADLFGRAVTSWYSLNKKLDALVADGSVLKKRANKSGRYSYGEHNKLLVHVPSGIPVDVFSSSTNNWGMSLVVRTGSKDFNVRMMARFRELGMRGHAYGGVTDQEGNEIECPDEETVFRLLGWSWMPPERRS